ncbi:alpha/beta fold hydrolase [Phytoactinopolyspora halotolerans]|uniref:Alpha/beta hydrolase n=1 Tax=Phytoactinopolyspora halotolerans TaxID=1981512 RepID=A0A6L9SA68_9ACTN|nr:alpha/beta hydrolase [Phytoactinopolyspora halotolerans]NEE01534.1 alpha/beta hydrolase [Phytoactinopolyspora halotolerans]
MQHVNLPDVELEFHSAGQGPPVLLIHGGNTARGFEPLARQPELVDRYQVVWYCRRGYAGSSPVTGSTSIAEQAVDALQLIDHLELDGIHLIGHSLGGQIALELAATAPDRIRSLTLMEPLLQDVPSAPAFLGGIAPAMEAYQEGRVADAARIMFETVAGPEWPRVVASVPSAYDDAVRDSPTFFGAESAALAQWSFDAERASNITAPVLSVVGSASGPFFAEGRELLHSWFPGCTDADVDATHFLPLEKPGAVADVLAGFLATVDASQPSGGRA